ncbi:hypothetical protein [Thioalkalivibrio sp. ALE9]|uniref:hypothetical protein n=1 Tax=Thioalkalivibrio sp. ALE9 TaxID=1158169 RepID=UPI0012DFC4C6|nr:hypothetical protein [Thioalkalivibrio sp. ALE9]
MHNETAKVTLDSNVWRRVASPDMFPNAPDIASIRAIRALLTDGKLRGYISETTFTLEQIPRKDRLRWLTEPPDFQSSHSSSAPNSAELSFSIGPSKTTQPEQIQMVRDHLEDAYGIGIRILRSKRIAGPNSPLLQDKKYFLNYADSDEYHKFNNRNGEVARELEARGFGLKSLKALGEANRTSEQQPWHTGLHHLEETDAGAVPELIAEWADSDAIATSIAHDVDYFCTNDSAVSASNRGLNSILEPHNAQALSTRYGIVIVTPDELVVRVEKKKRTPMIS